MHERVQLIGSQGKQVLLVDCSHCSASEVEKIARAVPDYITLQPRNSVLVLADFTGASFDQEEIRAMKESAVFDKPYIKRSAWIGAESFPKEFYNEIVGFSGRELPTFRSRQEALMWLTGNE
jgi:hypothetical protein